MSPDQIAILAAVLKLVNTMSGWPFGVLFFSVVVGPWVLALMLGYSYRRRFEVVVDMYEKNVGLVQDYAKIAVDLKDVIIMNTQIMQNLAGKIDTNQYCPAIRLEKQATGAMR